MSRTISNSDDIIDSRDVIARIAELEDEHQALYDAAQEAQAAYDETATRIAAQGGESALEDLAREVDEADAALGEWLADNGDERKALLALQEQAEGYAPDWRHGAALIRESYFEEYARELADDIGAVDRDAGWPNQFIDWERAADALKMDYTSVEWDGVTYWVR